MDQERQRIQDDLRGLLSGEVHCSDVYVRMYSSDASIYQVAPLGVVRPRGTGDVVTCIQYANENGLPVHARGAGTGLAGGCLGRGLVIDFSYAMRRIIEVDDETVHVQPGVVLAELNRVLALNDRQLSPNPASSEVTTIGSVIAVDRLGSRWPRYGNSSPRVKSLQVVLADGETVELGQHNVAASRNARHPSRLDQLIVQVNDLLERNFETIRDNRPQSSVNSSGFNVYDVLNDGQLNLARLMAGSEGTLGLITEAKLTLDPLPKHVGAAILMFDRLEKAVRAVAEVRRLNVSACDLLDRRLISLAREQDVRYDVLLPHDTEAILLIENEGESIGEVREGLSKIEALVRPRRKLAFASQTAIEPSDVELFRELASRVVPSLYRLEGSRRPLPFVEDIAVPEDQLADFVVAAQNVLKRHRVTASLFAHAAHGHLHLRPFLDLGDADDIVRMQKVAEDLYDEVVSVRGTISGEHGDGLSRSWYVRKQFGPLFPVFRELKRFFDPNNLLNPGKVADPTPQPLTRNLRPVQYVSTTSAKQTTQIGTAPASSIPPASPIPPANPGPAGIGSIGAGNGMSVAGSSAVGVTSNDADAGGDIKPGSELDEPPTEPIQIQLAWDNDGIEHAARLCNGCGSCRTLNPNQRMCPIFRFSPGEEASPRAKANLMRSLFTADIREADFGSDELKEVADLCVNCHQCRDECPAGVDIPKLMIECKAQYVLTNGLSTSDRLLTRLEFFLGIAQALRPATNFVLSNRRTRWLLEKLIGIAQGRKLPRIAKRSFMSRAQRRQLTRPSQGTGRKVLYFTDVYANRFDTALAQALVAIYQHNGIDVYVHPDQEPAGMALISAGAIERVRAPAARNVALLADAIRQGYHVITSEPSAALCLTHEYRNLADNEDTRLVAENTSDACDYLWQMHLQGQLELDLKPINVEVGYHTPCHLRALGIGTPGRNLLRLIPGIRLRTIEKGCSGMAGTFGLKQENFRNSLRAGLPLITAVRHPSIQVGITECSTCKIQMEQGTTKPTIHPLKILALAYGLMPEFQKLITSRSKELTVT